jgi:SAM-dependent methyltransferase
MEEIGPYYGSDYYSYLPKPKITQGDVQSNGKRFLDVGCGSGSYLVAMRDLGYDVYGIELDDAVVAAAQARGLDVSKADFSALTFASDYFDEIRLNHVLEHIHDFNGILAELLRVLKNAGTITISVPNIRSFDAGLFGCHWRHLDVPRHLYHFDRSSLRSLLEKHRFTDIQVETLHAPLTKNLDYLKGLFTTSKSIYALSNWPKPLRLMHATLSSAIGLVRYAAHRTSSENGSFLKATATKE